MTDNKKTEPQAVEFETQHRNTDGSVGITAEQVKTEPQSAKEWLDEYEKRFRKNRKRNMQWADIAEAMDEYSASLRQSLSALQAERDQAQASVDQLCGDVRACVADYNDEKRKRESAETQLRVAREALETLINWLDNDTLEIMKDTRRMGITFDERDCSLLREEIEKARKGLGTANET